MAKNVIKEIIIALLLCLAIILVLGLLLYEYVPMSKVIPDKVSYTTPEEVQQELLATGGIDESQIVMTYELDSSDLSTYRATQEYKPGKANPFSSYETAAENPTTNNSSNSGSSSSGTTNDDGSGDSSNESGGTYFQNNGTK